MRSLSELAPYRLTGPKVIAIFGSNGDDENGAFEVPSHLDGKLLRVIAAIGFSWEHVSVSRQDRCPTWDEMEQIARLFFRDGETAMQLHVPHEDHINCHPFCLHWWRPVEGAMPIPRPPSVLVGW